MAQVRRNDERSRYEVDGDDEVAGYAEFRVLEGRVVLTHTEIDDAHEGEGLGSTLARAALDDVRARGAKTVPLCPFIAGWIGRHPEYADLVDHRMTARMRE